MRFKSMVSTLGLIAVVVLIFFALGGSWWFGPPIWPWATIAAIGIIVVFIWTGDLIELARRHWKR